MHVVLNNHLGFTTLPIEARTSEHCTDTARATGVPVIHANAGALLQCHVSDTRALGVQHIHSMPVIVHRQ